MVKANPFILFSPEWYRFVQGFSQAEVNLLAYGDSDSPNPYPEGSSEGLGYQAAVNYFKEIGR